MQWQLLQRAGTSVRTRLAQCRVPGRSASTMDRPSDTDSEDLDDLELFFEFAATRHRSIRNRLVERHMGLAAHIAKRFSRSGGTEEDLRQVAMLGLVKAIDRFDPHYGVRFAAFAGSTIEGELKRHFRDHSWTVRVPRSP